jgi:hypothetical protein
VAKQYKQWIAAAVFVGICPTNFFASPLPEREAITFYILANASWVVVYFIVLHLVKSVIGQAEDSDEQR